MKKTICIITTVILIIALLLCTAWYLFIYDRDFTMDMLLTCARSFENHDNHTVAAWFYDLAYAQSDNSDAVAIELAQQYKTSGNYTKAEYTLYNAISDGGGVDLYVALSKLYVEQDKLLDAVTMLDNVANTEIKAQLDAMRPTAPTATPDPKEKYNQYISVTLTSGKNTIYFTTDGQYPSAQAAPYTTPITLEGGKTTIQALSVNDKGLVSPLVDFEYTVVGVVELFTFNDPAIEAAVRALMGVGADKELYTKDLWTITEFTVPEAAKNYADLQHFAYLEKLTITAGVPDQLSNISGLVNLKELTITETVVSADELQYIAELPLLKNLTLTGCNLSNIENLVGAIGLSSLDLSNNSIRNINAISSMKSLQKLYLQNNAVNDLSALSNNSSLTVLNVEQNEIATLEPISSLTALTEINANKNKISELGQIGNLKSLTKLLLAENNLTSIDQLENHTAITELDISTNQLTDIDCLPTLTGLMYLNFSYNSVSELPQWDTSCKLVTIDGSYNSLSSLENLGGLEDLNVVNMRYNEEISSVDPLADCPMLLEVDVYGTKVTDVRSLDVQGIVVIYKHLQ